MYDECCDVNQYLKYCFRDFELMNNMRAGAHGPKNGMGVFENSGILCISEEKLIELNWVL